MSPIAGLSARSRASSSTAETKRTRLTPPVRLSCTELCVPAAAAGVVVHASGEQAGGFGHAAPAAAASGAAAAPRRRPPAARPCRVPYLPAGTVRPGLMMKTRVQA